MMLLKLSVITICIVCLADNILGASTRQDVHFALKDPSDPGTDSSERSDFEMPDNQNGNILPQEEKPQRSESERPKEDTERPSKDLERPSRDPEGPSDEKPSDSERPQPRYNEREQPRSTQSEGGEHPVGVPVNHPEFNSRMQNFHLNYERACSGHGCQNGGRCTTEFRLPGRAYGCNCGSKLGGPLCEIRDPCTNSPCSEGDLCLTTSSLDTDCGRKCYNRRTGQPIPTRC